MRMHQSQNKHQYGLLKYLPALVGASLVLVRDKGLYGPVPVKTTDMHKLLLTSLG